MPQEDFRIPPTLSVMGRKAAEAILEEISPDACGGGCRAFYSPEEWKERGEDYGLHSVLIVCHDGGDLYYYFNLDANCYSIQESMCKALEKHGFYAEQCTAWYSAIYRI